MLFPYAWCHSLIMVPPRNPPTSIRTAGTFVQDVHNLNTVVDCIFWTPQYHLPELRGRPNTIFWSYGAGGFNGFARMKKTFIHLSKYAEMPA